MRKYSSCSLSMVAVLILLAAGSGGAAPEPAASGEWKPLFDGHGLAGWEVVGDADREAEDGVIVVRREEGQTSKGWLVTGDEFSDFKVRLKFQTAYPVFNSGVLFRDAGHAKAGRPAFTGFELQLLHHQSGRAASPSGSIHDLARAYPREIKPGSWTKIETY